MRECDNSEGNGRKQAEWGAESIVGQCGKFELDHTHGLTINTTVDWWSEMHLHKHNMTITFTDWLKLSLNHTDTEW